MARTKNSKSTEAIEEDDSEDVSTLDVKPGPGKTSRKLASYWLDSVDQFLQTRKPFYRKGNEVIKRFRDERGQAAESGQRRMNMLWANTKIMMPALYAKAPLPVIDRKFSDKDPVGRLSSLIAERSVRNEIVDNKYHRSVKKAVLDYLLPGQGQIWVRYDSEDAGSTSIPATNNSSMEDELNDIEGKNEETAEDTPETEALEDTGSQLLRESVPVDYTDWHDFIMLPATARTWDEVQAVGKRVMVSKKEARERFTKDIGDEMQPQTNKDNNERVKADTSIFRDINDRCIEVFEIWNKIDRRVYWVSTGYDYLCDIKEDPLGLSNFFPCPEPLFSTLTNDTLIPVPDYTEWQDQAIQIDELTQRIAMLSKACKVAGTYDAANGALKRLLDEAVENQLIPVDAWAMFAEKGGIAGSISFLPLTEVQQVLQTLQAVRQQCMQDLDIITGVNDIMRGTTDSRETLGGIRLKNNNTGTRLSDRQAEVARFCRDTIKIITEIKCKHCSDENLIESSGILYEDELDTKAIAHQLAISAAMKIAQDTGKAPPQAPPMGSQSPPVSPQMGSNVVPMRPPPSAPQMPPQAQPMAGPSTVPPPMPMQPPQLPDPAMLEKMFLMQAEAVVEEKVSKALALLRRDIDRRYRIDIEVDSTVYADAAQEREDAGQFLDVFTKFLATAEQLTQGLPEAVPLMGKMLQFAIRKFRAGRDLESALEDFVEKMSKKAAHLIANPPPNPDTAKFEAQKQQNDANMQIKQLEIKSQEQNDMRDHQKAQMEDERTMKIEAQEQEARKLEHSLDNQTLQLQAQIKEREFQMQLEQLERQAAYQKEEHEQKMHELGEKRKQAAIKTSQTKENK